jgi:ribosomal protein L7/L12
VITEQLDRIEAMLAKLAPAEDHVSAKKVQRHVIEMLSYMARGKKIEAIKECRAVAGVGLKEAKDLICAVMP